MKNKCILMMGFILLSSGVKADIIGTNSGYKKCGENCYWSLDTDSGILTISGTGAMDDFENKNYSGWYHYSMPWHAIREDITSVVVEKGITTIGNNAFREATNATSIEISDSVVSIGDRAFSNMINVTNLTIGNAVEDIGSGAFYDVTAVTNLTLPNSLKNIEDTAFAYMRNVTNLTIPDSVTNIERDAFMGMSGLISLTLPDSVEYIDEGAFKGIKNLERITVSDDFNFAFSRYVIEDDFYSLENVENNRSHMSEEDYTQLYSKALEAGCTYEMDSCEVFFSYDRIYSPFDNLDISNIEIQCAGSVAKCQRNIEAAGLDPNDFADIMAVKYSKKLADGSTAIYEDGKIIGYEGKRIYTVDEANQVAGKTNTFSIRYR